MYFFSLLSSISGLLFIYIDVTKQYLPLRIQPSNLIRKSIFSLVGPDATDPSQKCFSDSNPNFSPLYFVLLKSSEQYGKLGSTNSTKRPLSHSDSNFINLWIFLAEFQDLDDTIRVRISTQNSSSFLEDCWIGLQTLPGQVWRQPPGFLRDWGRPSSLQQQCWVCKKDSKH